MKASTLFVVGLVIGAVVVFLIRAATHSGEEVPPAASGHPVEHAAPPASEDEATLEVRLADDGTVAAATMHMPGGAAHVVRPGGHVSMGDFPARIAGREGDFIGHLHAHSATMTEITVRTADGELVAKGMIEAGDERAPENLICPVMGNEVDPEVYVDYEGRRIGFCCPGCDAEFLKDPEKYLKIVDEEIRSREGSR
ncbi:MAG: YHS domain-containing protein [Planctomycetota bacterium]|jgi:YHS domain-containing protein